MIADGFIAVQAEDAPTVKEIGQRVLTLAKGIGVGNSITPHAKAITEAADKRKWDSVRQELDRTQNSVQQAMNEVHDRKALAAGQSRRLAARHRGADRGGEQAFFSGRRGAAASAGSARLISRRDCKRMPEFNMPVVQEIQGALVEVRPLIDAGNDQISPDVGEEDQRDHDAPR